MSKDYYNILGVSKSAGQEEIKKAFRKLAHQYRPDKGSGNADKFKEASEAYSVLSDDKKRAEYDTYGQTFAGGAGPSQGQGFGGFDFSGFGGQGGGFDFSQNGFEFDLGDIFGDFFGGGARERVKRGRDISIDVELPFSEAIFGTERKILLTKTSRCEDCTGSGAKRGTEMHTCHKCNGKGKVHETKRSFLGNFSTVRVCDECQGKGKVPKEKCPTCHGVGVLKQQEEVSVAIPAGIDDGEMIRLSGGGEAVASGTAGDLYIKVHVKRHPMFKKRVRISLPTSRSSSQLRFSVKSTLFRHLMVKSKSRFPKVFLTAKSYASKAGACRTRKGSGVICLSILPLSCRISSRKKHGSILRSFVKKEFR